MYESDPFTVHKLMQEETAKNKAALEASSSRSTIQPQISKEFVNAPEAKMSISLRDTVEDAIRKVCK